MKNIEQTIVTNPKKKTFFHSKGVTYFNKKTERAIFFILTIAMLVWGIFTKLGF
jgi:hypothetical protein